MFLIKGFHISHGGTEDAMGTSCVKPNTARKKPIPSNG